MGSAEYRMGHTQGKLNLLPHLQRPIGTETDTAGRDITRAGDVVLSSR